MEWRARACIYARSYASKSGMIWTTLKYAWDTETSLWNTRLQRDIHLKEGSCVPSSSYTQHRLCYSLTHIYLVRTARVLCNDGHAFTVKIPKKLQPLFITIISAASWKKMNDWNDMHTELNMDEGDIESHPHRQKNVICKAFADFVSHKTILVMRRKIRWQAHHSARNAISVHLRWIIILCQRARGNLGFLPGPIQ